ncbi:MAG: hypothetical protein KTR25_14735 [Myxococcales bacterium]|nr:hypothetical protein [Myxococcales bacterium]
MKIRENWFGFLMCGFLITGLIMTGRVATATTVGQMNLGQMVDQAERIFSGRVVDITESSVQAGGGNLPAVIYRIQVLEAFKGQFEENEGKSFANVKMLGTLKQALSGQHPIANFPVLERGKKYLLMVAQPGRTGLTTTMGFNAGLFAIDKLDGNETAVNGANNVGLYRQMSTQSRPESPTQLSYSQLRSMIRQILGENK